MLAHFYIPKLSNDMKFAVQKKRGQIWYRTLAHVKKRRLYYVGQLKYLEAIVVRNTNVVAIDYIFEILRLC